MLFAAPTKGVHERQKEIIARASRVGEKSMCLLQGGGSLEKRVPNAREKIKSQKGPCRDQELFRT
jgi:hypothetical protein